MLHPGFTANRQALECPKVTCSEHKGCMQRRREPYQKISFTAALSSCSIKSNRHTAMLLSQCNVSVNVQEYMEGEHLDPVASGVSVT